VSSRATAGSESERERTREESESREHDVDIAGLELSRSIASTPPISVPSRHSPDLDAPLASMTPQQLRHELTITRDALRKQQARSHALEQEAAKLRRLYSAQSDRLVQTEEESHRLADVHER
jgi:hypothetical protein